MPPSLLSMVLNGHRNPSKKFTGALQKWLQAPAKGLSELLLLNVNDIGKYGRTKVAVKVSKHRVVTIGESEPTTALI
ncbi:MAG: hypothetical protein HOE50_01505 [Chloroflexi bacterium]|nr:hypothetical protein [Chloroflexota bacterium]MBT4141804.1 hypothetical protein [Chloroflexota bacterium]MBT4943335.1 hypothetical protein [Chloroflexota bacterium]MBT5253694.1 hypothetical protein [Chloroflexota bacterium]MBT5475993.1 hypothetical protein [Chloroflexota bacterium]